MGKRSTPVLTSEQIEIISKTAANIAIEQYIKESTQQDKRTRDRRVRNVKLLLRNYRAFVAHVGNVEKDIGQLNNQLALDELDTDELAVKSIIQSKERTLALIQFINRMLTVYKIICEQSQVEEDKRRYRVVYHMYLAKEKKLISEISELQFVTERTIFNDLKKAHEELAVLIFGVDGLRFR